MSLVLHCGALPATFEDICSVNVPPETDTYRPVPHGDLVRLLLEETETRVGLTKPEMQFGMSKDGNRLFGILNYKIGDGNVNLVAQMLRDMGFENQTKQYGYAIALRNSYDKSMSVGIAGGVNTFACDNLALSGSDFSIKMPHTKNVWNRIVPEVMVRVKASVGEFVETVTLLEAMKGIPLLRERQYEVIGLAQGMGILTPVQAGLVFKSVRSCHKHPDHTWHQFRHSAFGLYQHFTQSLKLGKDYSRKLDKYTGVSTLFKEKVLDPATVERIDRTLKN